MKVQSAKLAACCFLAMLTFSPLSACGVFEVGVENISITPEPTQTPPGKIVLAPTNTVPLPTKTPFPGHLEPGQLVKIIQTQMRSKTSGWAIGQVETDLHDHILVSLDGGRSWQDRTPPDAFLNPPVDGLAATVFWGDDGSAWVTYASQSPQPPQEKQVIWHTIDYGQTWQAGDELDVSGFQAEYFIPSELGFIDAQHGWLLAHLGAGMSHDYIAIFTTADGGQTWKRIVDPENKPELMGCYKTGLAFSTMNNAWLIGHCPGLMDHLFFYTTTDGGQNWQQLSLPLPANQPADLFSSGKAGCGIPELSHVTARSVSLILRCEFSETRQPISWLYVSKDGDAFTARLLPLPFAALSFINSEEIWMIGSLENRTTASGVVYHTINGGQAWLEVMSTYWQGAPDFIDGQTGWVVARSGDDLAFVYTQNGGLAWEELHPVIAK